MLDADVFVLEPLGFVLRFDQKLVEPARDVRAGIATDPWQFVEFFSEFGAKQIRRDFALLEQPRYKPVFLLDERAREMLDIHRLMLASRSDVLRFLQRLLSFLRELV